jgi:hypothetical protein
MSKFLLNLFVQISKALVYLKIEFYSEKNFSITFGPSGPSAQSQPIFFSFQPVIFSLSHWASASRPAQLTLMVQLAVFFLLPHRSQARTTPPPAGLAPPHGRPRRPPPEGK